MRRRRHSRAGGHADLRSGVVLTYLQQRICYGAGVPATNIVVASHLVTIPELEVVTI